MDEQGISALIANMAMFPTETKRSYFDLPQKIDTKKPGRYDPAKLPTRTRDGGDCRKTSQQSVTARYLVREPVSAEHWQHM